MANTEHVVPGGYCPLAWASMEDWEAVNGPRIILKRHLKGEPPFQVKKYMCTGANVEVDFIDCFEGEHRECSS